MLHLPNLYRQYDILIDFKRKQVQPPQHIKGAIARTYFYMADRYKLKQSKKEKKLFKVWDKQNPPSRWECKRNELIKKKQGNGNRLIKGC